MSGILFLIMIGLNNFIFNWTEGVPLVGVFCQVNESVDLSHRMGNSLIDTNFNTNNCGFSIIKAPSLVNLSDE